jgi:hypothetical protein
MSFMDDFEVFKKEYRKAVGEGNEEFRQAANVGRELEGKVADATRLEQMLNSNATVNRLREVTGTASPQHMQARADLGLGEAKGIPARAGQLAGTLTADLVQDRSRQIWWLINALQATGNIGAEAALNKANPNLYSASTIQDEYGPISTTAPERAIKAGAIDPTFKRKMPGIAERDVGDGKRVYTKRNFRPGNVALLNVAPGIAINTGLGLMTPFGGAEGYEAAVPSAEDKTKTDNVIAEVATKYILGRTGNLLPYDEFVKVRPDVSKAEYNAYKAFKWDKNADYDLTDGDLTSHAGAIKFTDEGIHGPEVQFLGRSLPVTTGVVPYLGSVAGGVAGVRTARPIKGGLLGSLGGLAAGQVAGNIIEGERRRRNKAENERQYNKENNTLM